MEKLCLLVIDYTTKWRHVLSKQEYFDEFGRLDDDKILSHNLKVLANHDFLMGVIETLNSFDPYKLSDAEKKYIEDVLRVCENFDEKGFISIF